MTLESTLYGILSSTFGGELYPIVHPDPDGTAGEVAGLYAIYLIVGGASFNKLDGDTDMSRPRVQVSIYGIDYDTVATKAAAVASAMKTANGLASAAIDAGHDPFTATGALTNVSVAVPTDGYEPDTKRFVKHNEFYCWWRS